MNELASESVIKFNRELGDWTHDKRVYKHIAQRLDGPNVLIQRTEAGQLLYSDRCSIYDITGAQLDRKANKERPFVLLGTSAGPGGWRSTFNSTALEKYEMGSHPGLPNLRERWEGWGGVADGVPLDVTTLMEEGRGYDGCLLKVRDGELAGQYIMVNRAYLQMIVPTLADFSFHSLRVDLTADGIVRVRERSGALMGIIRPIRIPEGKAPAECPLCGGEVAHGLYMNTATSGLLATKGAR
jgi:hypothetical protein